MALVTRSSVWRARSAAALALSISSRTASRAEPAPAAASRAGCIMSSACLRAMRASAASRPPLAQAVGQGQRQPRHAGAQQGQEAEGEGVVLEWPGPSHGPDPEGGGGDGHGQGEQDREAVGGPVALRRALWSASGGTGSGWARSPARRRGWRTPPHCPATSGLVQAWVGARLGRCPDRCPDRPPRVDSGSAADAPTGCRYGAMESKGRWALRFITSTSPRPSKSLTHPWFKARPSPKDKHGRGAGAKR